MKLVDCVWYNKILKGMWDGGSRGCVCLLDVTQVNKAACWTCCSTLKMEVVRSCKMSRNVYQTTLVTSQNIVLFIITAVRTSDLTNIWPTIVTEIACRLFSWWSKPNPKIFLLGFEVFTAVVMKSIIFWDVMPCSLFSCNRSFGGTYRLHLQGRRNNFTKNQHCNSTDYTASHPRRWYSSYLY
jgi:hypothetical protein